ncbi:MAG: hypothetical protein AAGA66_03655 [Bacteroidota bacterium]
MNNPYHILNGDALKQHFPKKIQGEIIVMRECFVEGPVAAKTPDELYAKRALFLSETEYYERVAGEFTKILRIALGDQPLV